MPFYAISLNFRKIPLSFLTLQLYPESRCRNSHVLVSHSPLQIATFWELRHLLPPKDLGSSHRRSGVQLWRFFARPNGATCGRNRSDRNAAVGRTGATHRDLPARKATMEAKKVNAFKITCTSLQTSFLGTCTSLQTSF